MNVSLSPARLELGRVNDPIARAGALIFDVDGTLAETEEVHRQAFNEAFVQCGVDWCTRRLVCTTCALRIRKPDFCFQSSPI